MNKTSSPFRAVQSKLRACRRTLCFQERFNANGAQLLKPGSENKPKWNIPQVFLILLFCGVLLCFGPCGTSLDLSLGDAAFCQNMASSLHQSGSQLWVLCLEALSVSACNWQHLWLRYTDDQEWQIWQGMGWIDRPYQLTACALNSELVYARLDMRFLQSDLKYTAWLLVLVKASAALLVAPHISMDTREKTPQTTSYCPTSYVSRYHL